MQDRRSLVTLAATRQWIGKPAQTLIVAEERVVKIDVTIGVARVEAMIGVARDVATGVVVKVVTTGAMAAAKAGVMTGVVTTVTGTVAKVGVTIGVVAVARAVARVGVTTGVVAVARAGQNTIAMQTVGIGTTVDKIHMIIGKITGTTTTTTGASTSKTGINIPEMGSGKPMGHATTTGSIRAVRQAGIPLALHGMMANVVGTNPITAIDLKVRATSPNAPKSFRHIVNENNPSLHWCVVNENKVRLNGNRLALLESKKGQDWS